MLNSRGWSSYLGGSPSSPTDRLLSRVRAAGLHITSADRWRCEGPRHITGPLDKQWAGDYPRLVPLSQQSYYHTGIQPITRGESESFFLNFFFVTFSGTLSLKSLLASTCLFLAGLASVVAGITSEVRFGVRGQFLLLIKVPSFSPTASSIIRTNSSWTGDDRRSLFSETAGGALMAEELFLRRLKCAAGFTWPVMLFFLRVK